MQGTVGGSAAPGFSSWSQPSTPPTGLSCLLALGCLHRQGPTDRSPTVLRPQINRTTHWVVNRNQFPFLHQSKLTKFSQIMKLIFIKVLYSVTVQGEGVWQKGEAALTAGGRPVEPRVHWDPCEPGQGIVTMAESNTFCGQDLSFFWRHHRNAGDTLRWQKSHQRTTVETVGRIAPASPTLLPLCWRFYGWKKSPAMSPFSIPTTADWWHHRDNLHNLHRNTQTKAHRRHQQEYFCYASLWLDIQEQPQGHIQ